jgi:uncharacterized membrane protein (DUF4010 family)
MDDAELLKRLGLALALGLLVGLERGWRERAGAEGSRVAGLRTFGLIGLSGGVGASVLGFHEHAPASPVGAVGFGLMFAGLAGLLIAGYRADIERTGDLSATTAVAALATFLLGGLAVAGQPEAAAAAAVVMTTLLGLKPALHRWVARLEERELLALLKLLLISVVMLPVLPDRGFGPFEALNPYRIWWMVVLIAGLSFSGYVAAKLAGPARGLMLAAVLGGFTSSTAVTLSFARIAKDNKAAAGLLAAGAALASATMLPRVLIVVGVVEPALLRTLGPPLALATFVALAGTYLVWRASALRSAEAPLAIRNPVELGMAVRFGLLLAAIMFLARALPAGLGDSGLFLLAAASGLADVDAISLSVANLAARGGTGPVTGAAAIALAVAVNTGVKIAIAATAGGPAVAWRLGVIQGAAVLAGLAGFLVRI